MITDTFTGTGIGSETLQLHKKPVTLSVTGFGSATVLLQRRTAAGTWVTAKTITQNTEETILAGMKGQYYRFNCTVWASGTIVCELGG
jgi:hypothetical protein